MLEQRLGVSEETREEGVLGILRKCGVRDGDEKLTCVGGGARARMQSALKANATKA